VLVLDDDALIIEHWSSSELEQGKCAISSCMAAPTICGQGLDSHSLLPVPYVVVVWWFAVVQFITSTRCVAAVAQIVLGGCRYSREAGSER